MGEVTCLTDKFTLSKSAGVFITDKLSVSQIKDTTALPKITPHCLT